MLDKFGSGLEIFLEEDQTFEDLLDIFATCEPDHPSAGIFISNEKSHHL